MNKNHRIIWNEVRNCFVVASEKTKSRGKPSTTRKTIAAAVAALLMGAPGMAAAVCSGTTPLSSAVSVTQCYDNVAAQITGSGSIIHQDLAHALGIIATDASLNNAGFVLANTTPVELSQDPGIAADALGIRFTHGLAAPLGLNNTGTISALVTDHYANSVDATAILIADADAPEGALGDLSSSLTNGNMISAIASSDLDGGEDAGTAPFVVQANGIVAGNLTDTGVLTNSGTIDVHATASGEDVMAYAHGVSLVGLRSEGAEATYAETFTSHTVFAGGDLAGSLSNTGTISANAQATGGSSASAAAYGIDLEGNLSGSLSNTGSIAASATATSMDNAYAAAYGILATNNPEIKSYTYDGGYSSAENPTGILSGSLTNSGTISAVANAEGGDGYAVAIARGVQFEGGIAAGGELTNDGSITADAHAMADYARSGAFAVFLGGGEDSAGSLSGTLVNNDLIHAQATAEGTELAWADAAGIVVAGEDGLVTLMAQAGGAGLTNNGTIEAYANATAAGEDAYYAGANALGIGGGGGGLSVPLINTGLIDVQATATLTEASYAASNVTAFARAEGISFGGLSSLDNQGDILVSATADASAYAYAYAYAYGISISTLNGALDNSGNIEVASTATGEEDAYAVAYGIMIGGNSAELTNSGTIAATATATGEDHAYAAAYGITIGGNYAGLTNSGTIAAAATATGEDAYAVAYGIMIGGNFADLTNSKTITATATATGEDAYAAAYGITIGGNYADLTNSGTIAAAATATGEDAYAVAYGIMIGGNFADLTNSKTITATATANGEDADAAAYGITIGGQFADLTNSGTITATATADGEDAYAIAYGLRIGYMGEDASLTNSGTITATATATASGEDAEAYAAGVIVGEDLYGTLTNTGTISATATATASGEDAEAYASGVIVGEDLYGTLTNSGTISATATSTASGEDAEAYASGVIVGEDLYSTLTNSGTISATATSTASGEDAEAYAFGVIVGEDLYGTLANSGTITATATADGEDAYAEAYGVRIGYMGEDAALTNSSTITATATATGDDEAYAAAYGVRIGYMGEDALLTNSGTIGATATASGEDAEAYAAGVVVGEDMYGTLTNSSNISATATADGENAYAEAYGVRIGYMGEDAALTNSGTISATATASGEDAEAYAYGVYAGELNGTLTNSGTITGTADNPANGYSLYVDGGSGTINNLAGGVLKGNLYVGEDVTVNNAGLVSIPAGAHGYINSDYTQQKGGVLEIGVVSASGEDGYGTLDVRGTADLSESDTIAVRVKPINTLDKGDKLNNVVNAPSAEGGLLLASGNAAEGDTVKVIGTPLFTYRGEVDAHHNIDIYIDDERTFNEVLDSQGNASIAGIGSTLDELNNAYGGGEDGSGPMDELIDVLYGLNSVEELARAAQSLTPLISSHITQATQGVMQDVNRIIQARQEGNRGLSSGEQFYGDGNFWFKPFGSRADQKQRGGVDGYRAKSYGLAFGADAVVSNATRVGAAFTYANSDVDAKSVIRQWGDVDSYQLAFYGSHSLDERTDVNFQVDFGHHKNDVGRSLLVPTPAVAKGSFNAWSGHVGGGIGRNYVLDASTTLTPSFRADYSYLRTKGYTETGAGLLNLTVNGFNVDELVLSVDGKLSRDLGSGTSFVANLGLGYDALADRTSITSAFVGGGSAFATQGIDPSKWLVRGGLGLVMKKDKSYEVTARYDAEGRSKYTNQTASVKVRIPF
ncbi:exported protein of unknown function [Sterolibacterium denitrificans]|uniref:Autotransporter domain-containing protein n=1 Tax=Sterolibacterium denitrificans TaxID=157592 RepID=A0A7Z7MVM5_9PROT|nr:autotransporter domain-containing protein [Sterolibacterium denitrificans]SMB28082.1 exported protein of unknown function [Sterolibacterium denitrificans]